MKRATQMEKTIVENMLESQAVELMEFFKYSKKHCYHDFTPDFLMSHIICGEMRKKKYLKFIRKKAKEKKE